MHRGQDRHDLAQQRQRLGIRPRRGEFEERRQVVRQLALRQQQPAALIHLREVHHRLPAIPALAMHMLEQMQRQPPPAVEQVDIGGLEIEEVRRRQRLRQRRQRLDRRRVEHRIGGKMQRDVPHRVAQPLVGIAEQGRKGLQSQHHITSIGFFARPAVRVANRLVVSPPEQPLPKVKPQPPRSACASSLNSRCAVGITKRSS